MKRIFIIISLLTLLTGITQAQWLFNGQNIYWPHGDVTVTDGNLVLANGSVTLESRSTVIYALGGAPQIVTQGTDNACDDGDRHLVEIMIPYTTSVTGVGFLVGSVGGTDSVIVELFDASGDLVAGCTSKDTLTAALGYASDIVGTAAQFQSVPFTLGAVTVNAGKYFISVQFDGTTAKYRGYLVTGSKFVGLSETGTAWTPASVDTVLTAGFNVDVAPISFIY